MKKSEMIKAVGEFVITAGVGFIVGGIVKTNVPLSGNIVKKCCVGVATAVISDMASTKACKYVEDKINETTEVLADLVKETQVEEEQES